MTKPKLLHISLGCHNTGMWQAFDNHFETIHFDWTQHKHNPHLLNEEVRRVFDYHQPDVVFMQLQNSGNLTPRTVAHMSKTSITVTWNGDVRSPIPRWEIEIGRVVDVALYTNMHYVDVLCSKGINAQYLQVGFDETIFTPEGTTNNFPPIIFLGSNYETSSNFPLSGMRTHMVQTLKQTFGDRFTAYGHNWQRIIGEERFLNQQEEAMAYRSCKIAINLSHFDYGRYSSDRMLRLMGSGAFCLSHNFKAIEEDFEIGKHLDVFHSIPNLITKIHHYLEAHELRENIRKMGCEYVRNKYTWNHFMVELKNIIGLN